jgi:hypothetical protein
MKSQRFIGDMRETYKVKGLDDSRSFINTMKSFPMNISNSDLPITLLNRRFRQIRNNQYSNESIDDFIT